MRYPLLIVLILFIGTVSAQQQTKEDIFPRFGNYQRRGWIVNPMITYTLRPVKNSTERLWNGSNEVYDIDYRVKGKPGVGIEIGRFHAMDNSRIISYVDLTLGYKILKSVETFEAELIDGTPASPGTLTGEGIFSHSYLTASFNATNAQTLSRRFHMQNTLGINGDYRINESYTYNSRGLPMDLNYPGGFVFQAHYKFGIGFKLSDNLMIVPSIETPIVTFHEYDDLKSTLHVFNSRFRPVLLRLGLMILDNKPQRKCPPKSRKRKSSESLFGSADGNRPW